MASLHDGFAPRGSGVKVGGGGGSLLRRGRPSSCFIGGTPGGYRGQTPGGISSIDCVQDRVPSVQVVLEGVRHRELGFDGDPLVTRRALLPVDLRDVGDLAAGREFRLAGVGVQVRAAAHVLAGEPGTGRLVQLGREVGRRRERQPADEQHEPAGPVDGRVLEAMQERPVGAVVAPAVLAQVDDDALDVRLFRSRRGSPRRRGRCPPRPSCTARRACPSRAGTPTRVAPRCRAASSSSPAGSVIGEPPCQAMSSSGSTGSMTTSRSVPVRSATVNVAGPASSSTPRPARSSLTRR